MKRQPKKKSTPYDPYSNLVLRGITILAVILLHVLSNVHVIWGSQSLSWQIVAGLDQLGRFCVPLFVALSGYGFWQKYQKVELKWGQFLWSQSKKLLPLYVLASGMFYLSFLIIPQWHMPGVTNVFLLQLLTGKADYHLYFVPMIFQFYLLFPLFFWLVKKLPWISLGVAGIFQVWLYLLVSSPHLPPIVIQHFLTDQQQYIWFFTWVFYFVLGMHMPQIIGWAKANRWSLWAIGIATVVTWWITTYQAMVTILGGIDPIIALRSTRVEILLYSSVVIIFLMAAAELANSQIQKLTRPVTFLGKYSYAIYLFHTIVLRALLLWL